MSWIILVPIIVGAATVLQPGFNRQIANIWGLAGAVTLNAVVFLVTSLLLYAAVRFSPALFPEFVRNRPAAFSQFSWWYLLPGVFGLLIVLGFPIGIAKLGAVKTFLIAIAVQILCSVIWDRYVEHLTLTPLKIAGAGLVLAGAVLVSLRTD